MMKAEIFDIRCTQCPRLSGFLQEVSEKSPNYYAKPVPPFGSDSAQLLIVGLAPGMHGANRTGRPFTGDHAGILLYETLYKYGFSTAAESIDIDDGLELNNCRITNAVKCLPPQNKPVTEEIKNCNHFLQAELGSLPANAVIIALGTIAHDAVLRAFSLKLSSHKFAHAAEHQLEQKILIDSYHCSRYNTQTRRLTEDMFHAVFHRAKQILG